MAKTLDEIEKEMGGLAKALNDATVALDGIQKAPKADPAKVDSLAAEIAKLTGELLTLKTAHPANAKGFFETFLDGIFS